MDKSIVCGFFWATLYMFVVVYVGMDNESEDAMVLNSTVTHDAPVYLKQSIPMIVVYTLAYSAVFVLGMTLSGVFSVEQVNFY